eukprot:726936_1
MEATYEIDKLRSEKKALECKLAGHSEQVTRPESSYVKSLKTEIRQLHQKRQEEVQALQDKLKWYLGNQKLIDSIQSQLEQKDSEIESLKKQLENEREKIASIPKDPESKPPAGKLSSRRRSALKDSRVKELEKQVEELQDTIASKHPDSLSQLIKSAQPSNDQIKEMRLLRKTIVDLEADASAKDVATIGKIRSLRQEHDKVELGLKQRIADLEKSMKDAKKDSRYRPTTKVREIERQLDDSRRAHKKQVAELKGEIRSLGDELSDLRARGGSVNSRRASRRSLRRSSKPKHFRKRGEIERESTSISTGGLEQIHDAMEQEMVRLRSDLSDAKADVRREREKNASLYDESTRTRQRETDQLDQIRHLQDKLSSTYTQTRSPESSVFELERLKAEHDRSIDRLKDEYEGKLGEMENTLLRQTSERDLSGGSRFDQKLRDLETERSILRDKVVDLEFTLENTRSPPERAEYSRLCTKIDQLEERARRRETELQTVVNESRKDSRFERLNSRRHFEDALHNKSKTISVFREELDALLLDLGEIKRSL